MARRKMIIDAADPDYPNALNLTKLQAEIITTTGLTDQDISVTSVSDGTIIVNGIEGVVKKHLVIEVPKEQSPGKVRAALKKHSPEESTDEENRRLELERFDNEVRASLIRLGVIEP